MTIPNHSAAPAVASVPTKLQTQLTLQNLDLPTLQDGGVNTTLLTQMFVAGYCVVLTRGLYTRCWQLQGLVANLLDAQLLGVALQARHRVGDIYILDPLANEALLQT